jgi:5-formyltetrahydrofolate cyclo-ligase
MRLARVACEEPGRHRTSDSAWAMRYHRAMHPGTDEHARRTLYAAKQALRARLLATRDALPVAVREADGAAIAARIEALPAFAAAHAVLVTLPFGSEWDTRGLAAAVLSSHRRLVVPRVDRTARMLALHEVADLARDVAPGYRGIPEPLPSCEPVAPTAVDFVLVPGVAFDFRGRRLGYGGGFYDRLLPLMRPDVAAAAGAFDQQIVDEVPTASHDRRVPVIVTPTRVVAVASAP